MNKTTLFIILFFFTYPPYVAAEDICKYLPKYLCQIEKNPEIKQATTNKKAKYHVIFRENIDSEKQKDWKQGYHGSIELWIDNKLKATYTASTLPNNISSKDKDHVYSVLMSTCHHHRYYTWKRGLRADGKRHALRLKHVTPTVNISTIRNITIPQSLSKPGHYKFSKNILVHKGWKETWRGSAGCLTINPNESIDFFKEIPMGVEGTLEVIREVINSKPPINDSYCY